MKIHTSIFTMFLAAAAVSAAFAQDDVVRVETNLVTLNVAVTDSRGNYVRDLGSDRFEILDNGKKQTIDTFSSIASPLSVGIVYDAHAGISDRTLSVLDALREFTKKLGPNDRYFVTVFGDRGHLTTEFVPNEQQLRTWVENGERKGPTTLYDSIYEASGKVARMPNPKKILIVLSDGQNRGSQFGIRDLRLRLRSINLPVYAVTFSSEGRRSFSYADINRNGPRQTFAVGEASDLDRGILAELSRSSGGQSFETNLRNRYYLSALCSKVLDEINNQYVIGFYPDQPDGRWHKLKVVIKAPAKTKYRVSSRRGYQSLKR